MKSEKEVVLSSHGDGGLLTHKLLDETFLPLFDNPWLSEKSDAAVLELAGQRLAFTTDSFVVSPLVFPGGDIGKLAACGTINDLVVSGAKPLWLSAAFILQEGFALTNLSAIVRSLSLVCRDLGIPVVAGDTKVAGRGEQSLFINTSGVGLVHPDASFKATNVRSSDLVLLTGSIGDHGAAVLSARLGIPTEESPESDCMPLCFLYDILEPFFSSIKIMRDPTRGGLATTLTEIASAAGLDILIHEDRLPVQPRVKAVAGIYGVDPLYLASEGRAVLVVKAEAATHILAALQNHPLSAQSSIIGQVQEGSGRLYLKTALGGTRPLQMLAGTPLPRIC